LPIEKFNLRNATKIIAVSENMKLVLLTRGKIDESKIVTIYNWQDELEFSTNFNNSNASSLRIYMYLGNIGPVSNIPYLITQFFKAKINGKLIIAGSGSLKNKCIDLVNQLKADNIEFLEVPTGKVAETQSMADVLILPTIKNGAGSSVPSKLPAYMFSKKPILAILDQGNDTYNAIVDSDCGWVVSPDDSEGLIKLLNQIEIIPDSDLKVKGINGDLYARKHFSKTVNLNRLTEAILSVCN
jgi:glycosyltransferase involved in cell wall biosynthesis